MIYYGSIEVAGTYVNATTVTGTFTNGFPPGDTNVRVKFTLNGDVTYSAAKVESIALNATSTAVTCSWAGGCAITFDQASILEGANVGDINVTVCGNQATLMLTASTTNSLVAYAPHYSSSHSLDTWMVEELQVVYGTVESNPAGQGANAFDGITTTQFVSASTDN